MTLPPFSIVSLVKEKVIKEVFVLAAFSNAVSMAKQVVRKKNARVKILLRGILINPRATNLKWMLDVH